MCEFQKLIILINQYLENSMAPNSFWDNAVEYALPILSMLVVIIGGGWTFFLYIKGKNREINERILSEVYLPLFRFFVRNDSLTQIANVQIDYKDEPFLVWGNRKTTLKIEIGETTQTETVTDVMGLSRECFLESIEKINLGLAPRGLVALLEAYKAANYAVDKFSGEKEICERATKYRSELEYAIRMEAYQGYKKYHKKLGLLNSITKDVCEICDDHIQLSLKPLPENCGKNLEEK